MVCTGVVGGTTQYSMCEDRHVSFDQGLRLPSPLTENDLENAERDLENIVN